MSNHHFNLVICALLGIVFASSLAVLNGWIGGDLVDWDEE